MVAAGPNVGFAGEGTVTIDNSKFNDLQIGEDPPTGNVKLTVGNAAHKTLGNTLNILSKNRRGGLFLAGASSGMCTLEIDAGSSNTADKAVVNLIDTRGTGITILGGYEDGGANSFVTITKGILNVSLGDEVTRPGAFPRLFIEDTTVVIKPDGVLNTGWVRITKGSLEADANLMATRHVIISEGGRFTERTPITLTGTDGTGTTAQRLRPWPERGRAGLRLQQ